MKNNLASYNSLSILPLKLALTLTAKINFIDMKAEMPLSKAFFECDKNTQYPHCISQLLLLYLQ
ncbi:MAG: hypothetical protein KA319_00040 [Ferruginibacter sp.]|nr:hypothetical protein [Ferruginibacter sp.]